MTGAAAPPGLNVAAPEWTGRRPMIFDEGRGTYLSNGLWMPGADDPAMGDWGSVGASAAPVPDDRRQQQPVAPTPAPAPSPAPCGGGNGLIAAGGAANGGGANGGTRALCKYFQFGQCARGEACSFLHEFSREQPGGVHIPEHLRQKFYEAIFSKAAGSQPLGGLGGGVAVGELQPPGQEGPATLAPARDGDCDTGRADGGLAVPVPQGPGPTAAHSATEPVTAVRWEQEQWAQLQQSQQPQQHHQQQFAMEQGPQLVRVTPPQQPPDSTRPADLVLSAPMPVAVSAPQCVQPRAITVLVPTTGYAAPQLVHVPSPADGGQQQPQQQPPQQQQQQQQQQPQQQQQQQQPADGVLLRPPTSIPPTGSPTTFVQTDGVTGVGVAPCDEQALAQQGGFYLVGAPQGQSMVPAATAALPVLPPAATLVPMPFLVQQPQGVVAVPHTVTAAYHQAPQPPQQQLPQQPQQLSQQQPQQPQEPQPPQRPRRRVYSPLALYAIRAACTAEQLERPSRGWGTPPHLLHCWEGPVRRCTLPTAPQQHPQQQQQQQQQLPQQLPQQQRPSPSLPPLTADDGPQPAHVSQWLARIAPDRGGPDAPGPSGSGSSPAALGPPSSSRGPPEDAEGDSPLRPPRPGPPRDHRPPPDAAPGTNGGDGQPAKRSYAAAARAAPPQQQQPSRPARAAPPQKAGRADAPADADRRNQRGGPRPGGGARGQPSGGERRTPPPESCRTADRRGGGTRESDAAEGDGGAVRFTEETYGAGGADILQGLSDYLSGLQPGQQSPQPPQQRPQHSPRQPSPRQRQPQEQKQPLQQQQQPRQRPRDAPPPREQRGEGRQWRHGGTQQPQQQQREQAATEPPQSLTDKQHRHRGGRRQNRAGDGPRIAAQGGGRTQYGSQGRRAAPNPHAQ